MTSVLVSCAAWLVGCCPVVFEPPAFWTATASNAEVEATTRRFCITRLVDRHARPGMRLTDFARLFDKAPWLNESIINWNMVAFCGWIPVAIDHPTSTTFSFRLFPELPGDVEAVYFRIAGQLDGETCRQLLHGQKPDGFMDAVILEVATAPGRQSPAVTWADASNVTLRLTGRILGSLIREGMTRDEVERILGRDDGPLPKVGMAGGILFMSLHYEDLGMWVSLIDDENGVLRVDRVTFRPLFD
jgi:hypothetical protein